MCLRYAEISALEAMKKKAVELRLHGVSVVLTVGEKGEGRWDPLIEVTGRFVDEANMINYLAIALAKVAEMLVTGKPSGTSERPLRKGEFGHKGGILSERNGLKIYIAFSGGTEEQDLIVAQSGMEAISEYLVAAMERCEKIVDLLEGIFELAERATSRPSSQTWGYCSSN